MIKPYFNINLDEYNFIIEKISQKNIIKFKNKKILISGATGFIGKWLVGSLLNIDNIYKLNLKINIISRKTKKVNIDNFKDFKDLRIYFIKTDIEKINKINLGKQDIFINLATDTSKTKVNDVNYVFNTVIKGTKNIVEALKKNHIPKIIHASSGAAYGDYKIPKDGYKETVNQNRNFFNDNNFYGLAKKKSEDILLNYSNSSKTNIIILRIFSLIGSHFPLNSHYAISNFTKNALSNKNIKILGNGKDIRTYMDICDLIIWIIKIMIKNKNKSKIINAGSNEKINILSLAKKIIKISKSNSKILLNKNKKNHEIRHKYFPNLNLAKKNNLINYVKLNKSIYKYILSIKNK